MKRHLPIWLQVIVLGLLGAGGVALWLDRDTVLQTVAAFTGKSAPQRTPRGRTSAAVPVLVKTVTRATDDITIEAIATARAKRFVTLLPEAEGEVIALNVEAGDRVAAGDVILRLESSAAELAVDMVKLKLADAETKFGRTGRLRDRNFSSQANVEDAKFVMEQARVGLKQAEEALDNRTIRAPFAGVVGIPKVESGDRITTTTPVITVDDRSEMIVEIHVAERYLARVAVGQTVVARTPGFPGRSFDGRVDKIDSRIDPVSRTVKVRATLPNKDDLLRPGMSFAIAVGIPGPAYPEVPELALQWAKGASFVWRVRQEIAEPVSVRSVKRLNDTILVEGDLQVGDVVVVEGVQRLRPGRPVQFAAPPPAPTT